MDGWAVYGSTDQNVETPRKIESDAPTADTTKPLVEIVASGPSPSPIPRSIGPYSIKQIIDSGGMGTVYLAVQEQPRRTVALKVMKH